MMKNDPFLVIFGQKSGHFLSFLWNRVFQMCTKNTFFALFSPFFLTLFLSPFFKNRPIWPILHKITYYLLINVPNESWRHRGLKTPSKKWSKNGPKKVIFLNRSLTTPFAQKRVFSLFEHFLKKGAQKVVHVFDTLKSRFSSFAKTEKHDFGVKNDTFLWKSSVAGWNPKIHVSQNHDFDSKMPFWSFLPKWLKKVLKNGAIFSQNLKKSGQKTGQKTGFSLNGSCWWSAFSTKILAFLHRNDTFWDTPIFGVPPFWAIFGPLFEHPFHPLYPSFHILSHITCYPYLT